MCVWERSNEHQLCDWHLEEYIFYPEVNMLCHAELPDSDNREMKGKARCIREGKNLRVEIIPQVISSKHYIENYSRIIYISSIHLYMKKEIISKAVLDYFNTPYTCNFTNPKKQIPSLSQMHTVRNKNKTCLNWSLMLIAFYFTVLANTIL